MAYLNGPASKTEYGVVEVGGNIFVNSSGVISIPQDIQANASVIFANMNITSDASIFNASITYANITTLTVANETDTGNLSVGGKLTVNSNTLSTSTSTGAVVVTGGVGVGGNINAGGIITAPQVITTLANIATANITSLTVANETDTGNLNVGGTLSLTAITPSTSTTTGALVIAGGVGVVGNIYAGELFDAGNRVVTSITPHVGAGLALSGITTSGPAAEFTVTNTGVLSLTAGVGITLSASTGNITISTTGTTFINTVQTLGPTYTATLTDDYIGVYSNAAVIVSLPVGINGRQYSIKDEYGQGSGKITVTPNGSEKIDNANTYIISVPFASITVVYRGGGSAPGWHII